MRQNYCPRNTQKTRNSKALGRWFDPASDVTFRRRRIATVPNPERIYFVGFVRFVGFPD